MIMSFFRIIISRHLSTSSLPRLSKLQTVPQRRRKQALLQAQQVLTDYLYTTRCLSFIVAEHISKNSFVSLSDVISRVEFCPTDFTKNFIRFLRYHPINEFEFFFESIGIPFKEIEAFLPANEFFLSEEGSILNVARALSSFGFPWNKLGKLYKEQISIFGKNPTALTNKLYGFKALGFNSVSVIGICLAFPFVLSDNDELVSEIDALFDVLKRVFLDNDLKNYVEENVDVSYEICMKIKIFYDLGCEKVQLGVMGKSWKVFVDYPREVLVQKLEFFGKLNARTEDVGLLLLRSPEILSFDLETRVFSVKHFLKHAGLSEDEINCVAEEYPYVWGKNRMQNLPHVMRALDLHNWFFDKIINGGHHLLANFDVGSPDEKLEKDFQDCLDHIQTMKNHYHAMSKLDFLLGIGFGENLDAIKALSHLHGTRNELQERFDCLLDEGIEFSKLCKMVRVWPKLLNQHPHMLKAKVNFLRNDLGCSLSYLDIFPGYFCFDLENRIRPRCRIHSWIKEYGITSREYSLASILAASEKRFIARLFYIHPAVPKLWFETFSAKDIKTRVVSTFYDPPSQTSHYTRRIFFLLYTQFSTGLDISSKSLSKRGFDEKLHCCHDSIYTIHNLVLLKFEP